MYDYLESCNRKLLENVNSKTRRLDVFGRSNFVRSRTAKDVWKFREMFVGFRGDRVTRPPAWSRITNLSNEMYAATKWTGFCSENRQSRRDPPTNNGTSAANNERNAREPAIIEKKPSGVDCRQTMYTQQAVFRRSTVLIVRITPLYVARTS